MPALVLWSNFWNYLIDGFEVTDSDLIGTFPSMYNNWFAADIMSMQDGKALWGPFVWYDMFSWAGFFNWWVDALLLDFIFIWELFKAITRNESGNWNYDTVEQGNFIDMNRLSTPEGVID